MTCCSSPNQQSPKAQAELAIADLSLPQDKLALPMSIIYGEREIQSGFHITEVKRAVISAMDCGANRESWGETVIQLLDVDGPEASRMTAGKFVSILSKAGVEFSSANQQPIVFELARPGEGLQLHDFKGIREEGDRMIAVTHPREALCKPALKMKPSQSKSCCGLF